VCLCEAVVCPESALPPGALYSTAVPCTHIYVECMCGCMCVCCCSARVMLGVGVLGFEAGSPQASGLCLNACPF
jgi:hypothetical protein